MLVMNVMAPNKMTTSSLGNIFRVTGPLCGEFTGQVNSPHKGQWRRALIFSLICPWKNGWVNNRETVDLRRHRAHYDVTVMKYISTHPSDSTVARVASESLPCNTYITLQTLKKKTGWGLGFRRLAEFTHPHSKQRPRPSGAENRRNQMHDPVPWREHCGICLQYNITYKN